MNLNRETAMRLWNKYFGKKTKVSDFAGRIMAKGAYNNRNSDFGWNIEHILPQSKGGATADYNLICCHIQTNDEKADKFPCFTANGIAFEILKVERHYEIRKKSSKLNSNTNTDIAINLYDSAAGIRLFKSLKGIQNKKRFVGTVFVYLKSVSNGAVIDFIERIFDTESISYSMLKQNGLIIGNINNVNDVKITITNYDMPEKSDTDELLDKCILLNTYLSGYFYECDYVSNFDIYYREDYFYKKADLFDSIIKEPNNRDTLIYTSLHNSLFINKLVLINTEAERKVQNNYNLNNYNSEYIEYNYIFTKLKENLIKEANG